MEKTPRQYYVRFNLGSASEANYVKFTDFDLMTNFLKSAPYWRRVSRDEVRAAIGEKYRDLPVVVGFDDVQFFFS